MFKIGGISFKNNIWNAPVPCHFEDYKLLNNSSTGAIVFKTVTYHKRLGNPAGWFLTRTGSYNQIALHNEGILQTISTILKLKPSKPIFLSIYGSEQELIDMIQLLNQLQISILLEWNISCPNVPVIHSLKTTLPKMIQISKHPIGIKINHTFDVSVLPFLEKHKVAFITAINSIHGQGGLPIHQTALETIKTLKAKTKIPLIGVGGVYDRKSADAFLNAGAIAVEIGTEYLREGISFFSKI